MTTPVWRWRAGCSRWPRRRGSLRSSAGRADDGLSGGAADRQRVRLHNGCVYTTWHRGGPNVMQTELLALGIDYRHSRPYHPQTCGKVERFHQTLKRWLARQARASTIGELQAQVDRFVAYYNEIRPHRAVGRRTPREAFEARVRA